MAGSWSVTRTCRGISTSFFCVITLRHPANTVSSAPCHSHPPPHLHPAPSCYKNLDQETVCTLNLSPVRLFIQLIAYYCHIIVTGFCFICTLCPSIFPSLQICIWYHYSCVNYAPWLFIFNFPHQVQTAYRDLLCRLHSVLCRFFVSSTYVQILGFFRLIYIYIFFLKYPAPIHMQ